MTDVESCGSLCEDCREEEGPVSDEDDRHAPSLCEDCKAQDDAEGASGPDQEKNGNKIKKDKAGLEKGAEAKAKPQKDAAAEYWTDLSPETVKAKMDAASNEDKRSGKPRFLFAFDFDHTIIDGNSDLVIQEIYHSGPIPERVKIVAKEQGWTTFMQEVFRFHYANNVSKAEFCTTLDTIPLVSGILDCMKDLYRAGGELIVISDANTFFISHILEAQGVHDLFARIIANPAEFDSSGQLLIAPYHNNMTCALSSRNLCKGKVFEEYIQSRKAAGTVFEFHAFAGDGINDFCPMLRLSQNDIAFPRKDFSIEPYIARMAREEMIIKAQKIFWTVGGDMTQAIIERLQTASPHARKYDMHPT